MITNPLQLISSWCYGDVGSDTGISLVEISTIAHATEDLEKVLAAMRNIIPKDLWGEFERVASIDPLEGHYGNPVTRIVARFRGKSAEHVARYILSRFEKADFETLIYTLERRFDGKGRIFVRVSKQDAYLGRVRLMDGDDIIRVVLTLPGARSVAEVERAFRSLRGEV